MEQMSAGSRVRKAKPEDAPALLDLLRAADAAGHVAARVEDVERALREHPTETVWIGPAGFAAVQLTRSFAYTRPTAELTELFVRRESRRQGLGRALLDAALSFAQERGALELFVRVRRSNREAVRFYEATARLERADHLAFRARWN